MNPRRGLSLLVLLLLLPAFPAAADDEPLAPVPIDDPAIEELLLRLQSMGPYDLLEIPPRKDASYAGIPEELVPYGGVEPFRRHFLEQMEYTGPGRAIPEPEDLETVKIGFLGPIMHTVSVATGGASHEEPMGIQMLEGARLAVEQANAAGGYLRRGIPFELVVHNDNGLWGASGNEIVDLAYKDKVWAILGTIDGANSHIAIRVALKAEIPMMNTGDTDPTFIETNIPWVFRVIGDDRQQIHLLLDYIYRLEDRKRVGIIRASNRYGRFGVRELRDGSRRIGRPIVVEIPYFLGAETYDMELARIRAAGVDAVVHWGDAADGARILNRMRELGMEQPFFASDRCATQEFLEIAGANAEGAVFGYPWDPERRDPRLEAFDRAFEARFGEEVGTYAAHGYDGMDLLLWSIQVAGLNRARIRDVLAYRQKPWPGVTGPIILSAAMDDIGDVYLARVEDGRFRYLSRKELGLGEPGPRPTADRAGG
jgi:ABC-type branched-subunit amino acid transport system substrate-binding protein